MDRDKPRTAQEWPRGAKRGPKTAQEGPNIFYQIYKDRDETLTYIVMEHYIDQESVDLHGKSDHFRASGPKLGECIEGRPIIKHLDAII